MSFCVWQSLFNTDLDTFPPPKRDKKRWVHLLTFTSIMFGFTWSIIYPFLTPIEPIDLIIFLDAGAGRNFEDFFYTPWILPLFAILDLLPFRVAHASANLLSFLGLLYAIRVFRGHIILLSISYPFLMLTFYGQVDGIYAFGLALMFVALRDSRPILASVGWMIAIVKVYVGLPLGLGLWYYYAESWKVRIKIVILMGIYGVASLFIWPDWIPDLLMQSSEVPPNFSYSIDTWRIFGPIVLVLWIPVLLSRRKDFVWWTVTWVLTVPYLWVWILSFLVILPIGPIIWGVQISYVTGFVVSTFLQIIPFMVYLYRLWYTWKANAWHFVKDE